MTASRRSAPPFAFVVDLQRHPEVEPTPLHTPPVDVLELADGWRLVFEIPGAEPRSLGIEVRGRAVLLRGERRPTECCAGQFLRVERAAGPFERVVQLPEEPDPEKATATYDNGLLTVDVRRASPKRRTISIQSRTAE